MNDFEEDPGLHLSDSVSHFDSAPRRDQSDDAYVRKSPDLPGVNPAPQLLEEKGERPQILRSAMKGGRRRFLADTKERTRAIAADTLLEQGKDRAPKSKELKQARKQMFDQVLGGKDAVKRAAVPQDLRQFNRVGFASQESSMEFDFTDAPQEILAQMESDKSVWKKQHGNAARSNLLFEGRSPVKTEGQQQDKGRKNAFADAQRSQKTLSENTKRLMGSLVELNTLNPQEAKKNAFYVDNNKKNPFQHTVGAIHDDVKSIDLNLSQPGLDRKTRVGLMERAKLLGSSDTNNSDATEHAHAQGQTRAYSKGTATLDPATGQPIRDAATQKPIMQGNERSDVVNFANNRGNRFSRFFSGLGNFFSKILPGSQRLFGAGRDTRFEAAPGQREARALLHQERDTFRRDARSGKLGLMRKFFGRTAGSGRSRIPMGPRQEERATTREAYANEQREMAAKSAAAGKRSLLKPPAQAHGEPFPVVRQDSTHSLEGAEIKQAGPVPDEQIDDQLLELSSMDAHPDHDED